MDVHESHSDRDRDTGSGPSTSARALSFGGVADAYHRARPSYPEDATHWLLLGEWAEQHASADVLEVGAGTGKLTQRIVGRGHRVLATDPLDAMLRHLVDSLPGTPAVRAVAEHAVMPDTQRAEVLRQVDALYDEYGRGADGMLLPYVTSCFKAVVRPHDVPEDPTTPGIVDDDGGDTDALLIDFS
jgi:SAM-dependent methyltransferase